MPKSTTDRTPHLVDVVLPLAQSEDLCAQKAAVADRLGLPVSRITELRLRKHSIDARQRAIKVQLRLEVGIEHPLPPDPMLRPDYPDVPAGAPQAVIA